MAGPDSLTVSFRANPVQRDFIVSPASRAWLVAPAGGGKTAALCWAAFDTARKAGKPLQALVASRSPAALRLEFEKWFPEGLGAWEEDTFRWSAALGFGGSVTFAVPHSQPPGHYDAIFYEGTPDLPLLDSLLAPGGRLRVASLVGPAESAAFSVFFSPPEENLAHLPANWLARRKAHDELFAYARYIQIPGVPERPVTLAAHHKVILTALQEVARGTVKRVMLFLPPGSAKALALDTPIPTPSGWKLMGNLRVGDEVFSDTGAPCRVTWVSPVWRDRPVYVVRTDCGDEILADHDHEWAVCLDRKPRKPLKGGPLGRTPKPDRDSLQSKVSIKETHELVRRRAKRPMILRAGPLNLPEVSLPVDPYVLGAWLGDGTSSGLGITIGDEDRDWFLSEFARRGIEVRKQKAIQRYHIQGLRAAFVSLGLLNDPWHKTYGCKYIPAVYFRGSTNQRLELLQGLVDTDGTVCRRTGQITFTNTNRGLALGVQELARSLGVKAGFVVGEAKLYGKPCGPVYRVSFFLRGGARLPRKAVLTRDGRRTPNTYVDVTPAGRADTVCIEVDSPSHLFLCGRSMTPTHNSSYASVVFPTWFMGLFPGVDIISVSYASDLAQKFGRYCRAIARSSEFSDIFQTVLSDDSSASDRWALTNGSNYRAFGMLSGITGNRADGVIIDDPVRGREDADSQLMRDKTWDAYLSDVRTRMKPHAWIAVIQTRWHFDDLSGRILPEDYGGESGWVKARDGEPWFVINIPAQAERTDDPLLRQPGEWLWPEWWPVERWEQERKVQLSKGTRNWASLYQQRPTPEEGDYFQRDWVKFYDSLPAKDALRIYGASDYAVTDQGGDFTVHGVFGVDEDSNIYLLDWWRGQKASDVWIEAFLDLCAKWQPVEWAEEAGQINKSVGPFITKRQRERSIYTFRKQYGSIKDKATRAQAIRARMAMGKVFFPRTDWSERIVSELLTFPAGKNDDQVDVLSLVGRMLDRMMPAERKKAAEKPKMTTLADVTLDVLWKEAERERNVEFIH